ncbi:Hsp20/alpha crystallin family protein [Phyllobacterium sp. LjRoot231]|uniref:Hsp20/alpha crystallin family protein n=1 Tax=Phyllobacterium sp. LjRoot231 TaxID=3342289 RepID=UPI003ECD9A32
MADKMNKLPIKSDKKTSVTSSSPRSTFENLRHEIDRIFDDFSPSSWRFPFGRSIFGLEVPHPAAWQIAPATDMVEKDKEYEISAELPGMDEKDIEIKLSNHTLSIKGEKSEEREEREKDYYLSERHYGSFHRVFQLPEGVDADKIEASFSKGVLKLKLPKTAQAQKTNKKIAIKAA